MKNSIGLLEEQDLINNPTTRLPICLCLDNSKSMKGKPIKELEKSIGYFFKAIKSDEIARYSVELSIVIFQDDAKVVLDFANIDRQQIPSLNAKYGTSLGKGVGLALDLLEKRKKEYSSKGIDYYQPWLVLMTDGKPGDSIIESTKRVEQLSKKKKITVFPVAIGDGTDIKVLKGFSTMKNNMVLKVTSPKYFQEFFEWLSQSAVVASQSIPGDKPTLPNPSPVIEIEL
jgi:uncharacterized protein YegL